MLTDLQRPRIHDLVTRRRSGAGGFTLAEVLAALLFMAILIPVSMHGVSVASRAGSLGQRKAGAMRVAERVLDEQIITRLVGTATPNGTIVENDVAYPWTIRSDPWTEDPATGMTVVTVRVEFEVQGRTYDVAVSSRTVTTGMTVVTVRVEFEVQGRTYDVAVSSLYDPNATTNVTATTSTAATTTTTP